MRIRQKAKLSPAIFTGDHEVLPSGGGTRRYRSRAALLSIVVMFLFLNAGSTLGSTPLQDRAFPTPAEMWERCKETLPPFSYTVIEDEVVPSVTNPDIELRKIVVRFTSQVVGQWSRRMDHSAVIHMPVDASLLKDPARRGKVVVVANSYNDTLMIDNYGEPIAARLGYPTMVLPIPGEYDGHNGESCWMNFFRVLLMDTDDPIYHNYFRLAIPYVSALDVFAEILEEENIRAVIGGHSKRATSAITAAAIDPDRIAGVVYMGNESTFSGYDSDFRKAISPYVSQKYIKCPVLYVGATNEDGYRMFNINRIQERMQKPWTIEYIPNYRHAPNSEIQILDWQMWVSHVFDGRPLTMISELRYEENAEGTIFRARIDSPNKIIQAKVWYVYCDDIPYWRDLMWYPVFLHKKGEIFEAFVSGKIPDAWLVEVKDVDSGCVGYVSSLPQDITEKPTETRYSRGWKSRNWEPKTRKTKKKQGNT